MLLQGILQLHQVAAPLRKRRRTVAQECGALPDQRGGQGVISLHCRPAATAASFESSVEEQRACLIDNSARWKWMHGRNQDRDDLPIRQPLLGVNVLADGLR